MAGSVRQEVDTVSLEKYLQENICEFRLPFELKQFGYGQSNPTYQLIAADGKKLVLRKKPPGRLLSRTAHQIEREYHVLLALGKTEVPVPRVYCLCEDERVIGTAFYIMEFLDGRIFEDPSLPGVSISHRTRMWQDAVAVLGKLHHLDQNALGLSSFGKSSGFYNRQLKTLSNVSRSQACAIDVDTGISVGDIPHFKEIVEFFSDSRTQPPDQAVLVHGDYKIDNLVFHKWEPRVIGILDWEMSTIGHPISDLSNLLSPFCFAIHSSSPTGTFNVNAAFVPSAACPGLPTRERCLAWYQDQTGWDASSDIDWGDAFATFRNAVIMQGIAARYALRQASSPRAREIGQHMGPVGEFCWMLVEKWKSTANSVEKPKL